MSGIGPQRARRAYAAPAACLAVALVLSACTHVPAPCPREAPAALEQVAAVNVAHDRPFRFPLDASSLDDGTFHAWFCDPRDREGKESLHHAAEDYDRPAGTPVYAVADGRVSYSGRAGGYGWLVIVDHPQFNLYSLYGHLSPSRWSHEPGPVSKGTLLGYLGDPWENGGSRRSPLEPHLHFGLRAGQRLDYPKTGEWRWMAGWIVVCPRDIGWLEPSLVITSGAVPPGGFLAPTPPLLTSLGVAVTLTYSALGAGMLLVMMRRRMRFQLLLPGLLLVTAGIVLVGNGMLQTHTLVALGIVLTGIGLFRLVDPLGPRRRSAPGERPGPT